MNLKMISSTTMKKRKQAINNRTFEMEEKGRGQRLFLSGIFRRRQGGCFRKDREEMKKGEVLEGVIKRCAFPNKGVALTKDGHEVIVKNCIPGQKISFAVQKVRKGKCEGRLLEVLEKSPVERKEPFCSHFGVCGGCTYQNLDYEQQLKLKEKQIKELLSRF